MTALLRARRRAASLLFASAMVATLMYPNVASAEFYQFEVDTLFAGKQPPDSSPPYLTVTLQDVQNVELTPGGDPSDTYSGVLVTFRSHLVGDDVLKAEAFYLNYNPVKDVELLRFDHQSGLVANEPISTDANNIKADGTGGDFDIRFGFPSKTGFGAGDTSSYLIYSPGFVVAAKDFVFQSVPSPLNSNTGGYYVASHIQEISASDGSTWTGATGVTGVVPEPASIVMVGMASVVGLGVAWRRRRRAVIAA